jgi:hypothetical protein
LREQFFLRPWNWRGPYRFNTGSERFDASAPRQCGPANVCVVGCAILLLTVANALAEPPIPPRRPAELTQAAPHVETQSGQRKNGSASAPSSHSGGSAGEPSENGCAARLQAIGLVAEPVSSPAAPDEACKIEQPVRLKSLAVHGTEHLVTFPDGPIVACAFAERFGGFVGALAQPLVTAKLGTPIKAVRTGPGFECRNRNRAAQGKLSAHGLGIAVDVAGFELRDGGTLAVTEASEQRKVEVLATLRTAACGWFTTILGPGSDPAHAAHWHLDTLQHGSSDRYRICQ